MIYSEIDVAGRTDFRGKEMKVTIHFENGKMTGKEISRLMRKCRVTIRELKKRTGITLKRIREIREIGLTDPNSIRDWIEAITGKDPGPVLNAWKGIQR